MLAYLIKIFTALFKNEALIQSILDYVDRRNKKKAKQKFLNTVAVYDSLNTIINNTNIQRILVFRIVHDNQIAQYDTTTCIKEVYTSPFHSERENYIDYPVDQVYARMLKDLYEGDVEVETHKMKPGVLRDIYESNGVQYSLVTRLCDGKTKVAGQDKAILIYMSLASSFSKDEFGDYGPLSGAKSRVILSSEVNKIRNYYRKYYS